MKKKKKKALPPRCNRMKRPARLQSAKTWVRTYSGKNLVIGYCKHYAVDWRCAVIELTALGIKIDPAYVAQREETEAALAQRRQAKKLRNTVFESIRWHDHTDPFEAYLDGDYPAMNDLELREQGREAWEAQDFLV